MKCEFFITVSCNGGWSRVVDLNSIIHAVFIYSQLILCYCGRRVIGISGSLICSKTLIFNPCDQFRWSSEGPVRQIHSPHLHAGAPGIISDILSSVQMLKREWGAESNGKLPHLFIPSKIASLVPEFAVEDVALGRTAALVPGFAVKNLPFGRTL